MAGSDNGLVSVAELAFTSTLTTNELPVQPFATGVTE